MYTINSQNGPVSQDCSCPFGSALHLVRQAKSNVTDNFVKRDQYIYILGLQCCMSVCLLCVCSCLSSVVFLKHGSESFSFSLAGWMQSSKFLDSGRIHSRANVSCQSVTSLFYFLFSKVKDENDANCVMALP